MSVRDFDLFKIISKPFLHFEMRMLFCGPSNTVNILHLYRIRNNSNIVNYVTR